MNLNMSPPKMPSPKMTLPKMDTSFIKSREKLDNSNKKDLKKGYDKGVLYIVSFIVVCLIILIAYIIVSIFTKNESSESVDSFSNDPYGSKIRFQQSRDDTGSPQSALEERRFAPRPIMKSNLTGFKESPNFSKHYNIEANIEDGKVMIERENVR